MSQKQHNATGPSPRFPNHEDLATAAGQYAIISSQSDYKNITLPKTEKKSDKNCLCPACMITQDFATEYYNNASILRDNDALIHIPKVVE
jgi:hypothetical protein